MLSKRYLADPSIMPVTPASVAFRESLRFWANQWHLSLKLEACMMVYDLDSFGQRESIVLDIICQQVLQPHVISLILIDIFGYHSQQTVSLFRIELQCFGQLAFHQRQA